VPFIGPQLPNATTTTIDEHIDVLPYLNIPAENDVISMEILEAGPQIEFSGSSANQSGEVDNVGSTNIVLALAAMSTNFLNLELQPDELDAIPPKQGQLVANDNQGPDQQLAEDLQNNNIQHIGMALCHENPT
jgi:hypothetical protein